MSAFGCLNNGNTNATNLLNGLGVISGGSFTGGGTLTGVRIYLSSFGSGGNWRCGVYVGGSSDSDPSGATLLWDSGLLSNNFGATPAFQLVTASGGPYSLPSSDRIWVYAMSEITQNYSVVDAADDGDFFTDFRYYLDAVGGFNVNDASVALPSTISASPSGGGGTAFKAFIEFDLAGVIYTKIVEDGLFVDDPLAKDWYLGITSPSIIARILRNR